MKEGVLINILVEEPGKDVYLRWNRSFCENTNLFKLITRWRLKDHFADMWSNNQKEHFVEDGAVAQR